MPLALVLERQHELALRDIDLLLAVGPGMVKIAIHTVGVCGSDVHYYTHGKIGPFVVNAPMVLESPVNFECRLVQILEFGEHPSVSSLVIGEVVMAHIKDEFFANGELQSARMKAVGRLLEPYCRTTDIFEFKVEYTL